MVAPAAVAEHLRNWRGGGGEGGGGLGVEVTGEETWVEAAVAEGVTGGALGQRGGGGGAGDAGGGRAGRGGRRGGGAQEEGGVGVASKVEGRTEEAEQTVDGARCRG